MDGRLPVGQAGVSQCSEGVAFRAEPKDLGLSITNHRTFGQVPFPLCPSGSSPVKQSTSLSYLLRGVSEKKVL